MQSERGARARSGPIPSLDGVRALSVALVFFSHNGLGDIVPGGLGVTVFFVLSGFLITTLMRIEFAQSGTVGLRAFYLRRFVRLMPPLFIVTCLSVAMSLIASLGNPFTPAGLTSVLAYFSNYYLVFHGQQGQPPGLGVTWSLAVEEHFYFLYPPLAMLLLRWRRPLGSALVLAALCVGILAWRCWLVLHGASDEHLNVSTDTRVDAILVGCLLAFARNPWLEPDAPRSGRDLTLAVGCIALIMGSLLWRGELFRETFRYTIQSVSIAGLLYLAVSRAQAVPFRWLNARPLVYLGTVSYTIYLSHYLVLLWAEEHFAAHGLWVVGLATGVVTLVIAELMRRFVEAPCAALRRRLHETGRRRHPPVGVIVGGSRS